MGLADGYGATRFAARYPKRFIVRGHTQDHRGGQVRYIRKREVVIARA